MDESLDERRELLDMLARTALERRRVVLSSGKVSDYYLDCRRVTLHPRGVGLCAELMFRTYRRVFQPVDAVGGPTLGADPLVTAFMLRAMSDGYTIPGFLVRKQAKGHGMRNLLEGRPPEGARVLLVEDVLTTGGSLLRALGAVREAGLEAVGAVVLVDRGEGGVQALRAQGLQVEALFHVSEVLKAAEGR